MTRGSLILVINGTALTVSYIGPQYGMNQEFFDAIGCSRGASRANLGSFGLIGNLILKDNLFVSPR
jgi:hypothetical protein